MEIAAAVPDPISVTIPAQAQKPLIHIFVRYRVPNTGKRAAYKGKDKSEGSIRSRTFSIAAFDDPS